MHSGRLVAQSFPLVGHIPPLMGNRPIGGLTFCLCKHLTVNVQV